jgi:hypothetical protein
VEVEESVDVSIKDLALMPFVPKGGFAVHVDVTDLLKFVKDLDMFEPMLQRNFKGDVIRTAALAEAEAKTEAPVFEGFLVNSIMTIPPEMGIQRDAVEIRATVHTFGETYAMVQEVQRRPGQRRPPLPVIERYVHLKARRGDLRLLPANYAGEPRESRVRRTAYVVARAIGVFGTPGFEYMYQAFKVGEEKLPIFLQKSIDGFINRMERGRRT